MSDNYVQFSEALKLKRGDEKWLKKFLERFDGPFPEDYAAVESDIPWDELDMEPGDTLGFSHDLSAKEFWIYSDEHGNIDHVAHVIQAYLKARAPKQYFSLSYAATCSRPQLGEFGGGAIFVTARKVKYFSSGDFLCKEQARFEKRSKGK